METAETVNACEAFFNSAVPAAHLAESSAIPSSGFPEDAGATCHL